MSEPREIFQQYLSSNGLKLTAQRKFILNILITLDRPVTPEELFDEGYALDKSISLSTVYRTLKHLSNAGVARCIRLPSGVTRYACVRGVHNHLVCERCGKRIPIDNPYMDCLQREVARQEGFRLYRCQMEIHGICHECAQECECPSCADRRHADSSPPRVMHEQSVR